MLHCLAAAPHFAPPGAIEQLRCIVLQQATKLPIAPAVGFMVRVVKGGALTRVIGFIDLIKAGGSLPPAFGHRLALSMPVFYRAMKLFLPAGHFSPANDLIQRLTMHFRTSACSSS